MTAFKLKVDVKAGTLEVEGTEDFVRATFEDFRQFYAQKPIEHREGEKPERSADDISSKQRGKRQSRSKDDKGVSTSNYKPEIDKGLDTSRLREFYSAYEPKNNPEKIVIFCKFLEDQGLKQCTLNQIYTCYVKIPERVPKAFVQTMRDAANTPYGYIDFEPKSLTVQVTTAGLNHFTHDLKKKS